MSHNRTNLSRAFPNHCVSKSTGVALILPRFDDLPFQNSARPIGLQLDLQP